MTNEEEQNPKEGDIVVANHKKQNQEEGQTKIFDQLSLSLSLRPTNPTIAPFPSIDHIFFSSYSTSHNKNFQIQKHEDIDLDLSISL